MLVVDASVAVKFLVREIQTDEARLLLTSPDALISPDWMLVEFANVLWKKVRRAELSEIHAQQHVLDLPRFFARLHASAEIVPDALQLSFRLSHPVYDCLYLALALRENVSLVTADAKFHRLLVEHRYGEMARLL